VTICEEDSLSLISIKVNEKTGVPNDYKMAAVNFVTIFIIVLWSNLQGSDSNLILLSKILVQVAFILLLINLNMYFIFLIIRKSKRRDIKIRLAKISKRMMKYHVAIAVTASLLVLLHAGIMVYDYYENLTEGKIISGIFLSLFYRFFYSGTLRRKKAIRKEEIVIIRWPSYFLASCFYTYYYR